MTLHFVALCYAELAAMIPVAGSAYTFGYIGLGELWVLDHRMELTQEM